VLFKLLLLEKPLFCWLALLEVGVEEDVGIGG
jgi:hypothetical protein